MTIHINPSTNITLHRIGWAAAVALTALAAVLLSRPSGPPPQEMQITSAASPQHLRLDRPSTDLMAGETVQHGAIAAKVTVDPVVVVLPPVARAVTAGLCQKYAESGAKAFARVIREGDLDDPGFAAAYAAEQKATDELFGTTCAAVTAGEMENWLTSIRQLALQGDMAAKTYLLKTDYVSFLRTQDDSEEVSTPDEAAAHTARKSELISQAESLIDAGEPAGMKVLASILINDKTSNADDMIRGIALNAVSAESIDGSYESQLADLKDKLEPDQYATVVSTAAAYRERFSKAATPKKH